MKSWLAVCALLGGGALAVAGLLGFISPWASLGNHLLAWDAKYWLREPWTLWTAAWVHSAGGNLAGNLLALLAVAIVGASLRVGRDAALALVVAWPAATLALELWTDLSGYHGLGGPIHAAVMVLWGHVAWRSELKPLSALLFFAMALKLMLEKAWLQPVAFDPSWGFNVIYAAHLTGAAAGAVCGLAAGAWRASRGSAAPAP